MIIKCIHNVKTVFLLMLAAMIVISCSKKEEEMQEPTLYDRLGGTTMVTDPTNPGMMIEQGRLGLRSVVDSTIMVIVSEGRILQYFAPLLAEVSAGNTTNLAILSNNLTDFFSAGTGSENFIYRGLNMKDAHDPSVNPRMAIKSNNADMDIFVESVVKGAQQNGVTMHLITEVGEILESLRADVVQR